MIITFDNILDGKIDAVHCIYNDIQVHMNIYIFVSVETILYNYHNTE